MRGGGDSTLPNRDWTNIKIGSPQSANFEPGLLYLGTKPQRTEKFHPGPLYLNKREPCCIWVEHGKGWRISIRGCYISVKDNEIIQQSAEGLDRLTCKTSIRGCYIWVPCGKENRDWTNIEIDSPQSGNFDTGLLYRGTMTRRTEKFHQGLLYLWQK